MKHGINNWQLLSLRFNQDMEDELKQQHLAVQLIALAGRHLIPNKPDKTNINMEFLPGKEMFLGNTHPDGWAVGVHPRNLTVQLLDENGIAQTEIPIEGKNLQQAFQAFKVALQNRGTDVSELKVEQPYNLFIDALQAGQYFILRSEAVISEIIRYRHNARLVIHEQAGCFPDVKPVRVWPHHFDTGTVATLQRNEKGDASRTIGLGWAIPDSMIDEPYFYLSFWSENSLGIENKLDNLPAGKWMMPEWNGAVLPTSEIIQLKSAGQQYNLVKNFFHTGIESIQSNMK